MNPPAFKFPRPLGAALSLLPKYPHSLLFSQVLNLALGRLIKPELLEPLHGKRISIRVTDAGLGFFFTINSSGFVACRDDKASDLAISATAHDFLLLATRKEDPDTLFFSRRLVVEGDTELGLIAKNTLDTVELPKLDFSRLLPGKILEKTASRLLSAG
ncbi:MAG: ubiquinone anaerobic biosynthesis accessory factor UbiT [Sulfuricella sp.]|nr:SCP2 sterol-binding domain-containing protein [Gammaproteobacteria bacterium]